ncbi:hypothetical protein M3B46_06790 [Sphingobacterium daejeonense]|uniref:hypothetical protein n=1 Tax=Sphingobacterium daejeonense TaxID=371142 RepID=UPI0021A4EB5A|nr:hypothetical protein [Sphingobacterium daejeonense]MCT1530692.1 hypothetical protein [Sphingobacterium daejeonense]
MKKYLIILVCLLTLVNVSNAQEKKAKGWIFGPSIGYQYQSGSFLKASAWTLFAPNQSQYIKFDAGANFTWMLDQTTVIPEFGVTYYLNNVAVWPFIKGEITPYTATAKAGISIFSMLELSAGYGFDINTKENFKPIDGFTIGVGINVPLKFHLN